MSCRSPFRKSASDRRLLLIPGFISHVELQWDLPAWGGLIDRLARFSRLIVFDKRGMGLSDRNLGAGALEDRMDDIRAVLDACDVERAALVGHFRRRAAGDPVSGHLSPTASSHLTLYASYAWGGGPSDRTNTLCEAIETGWGTGMMADIYVQGCDERARQDLARFERFACTPTSSAEKMRFDAEIDVRPVLNAVRAPTLVLHNERDPR